MTAIDFPNSPTLNQIFSASGRTWKWNGTSWGSVAGDAVAIISDTAPTSATSGDLWYSSTDGRTYIYYGNVWVELSPGVAGKDGQDAVHPFLMA